MQGLTVGRIVHYVLSESEADVINRFRNISGNGPDNLGVGAQVHQGNRVSAGEHVAMIVVAVWDHQPEGGNGCCNGQVLLDGNDSVWVTSCTYGEDNRPGSWHWIEPA
jgi:hypothetical protein